MAEGVNTQRVQARVAGRVYADELVQQIKLPPRDRPDFVEAMLDELAALLPAKAPTEPEQPPASLSRLEAARIPFGRYQNKPFSKIPPKYLDWLLGESETLCKLLREYLDHPDRPGKE